LSFFQLVFKLPLALTLSVDGAVVLLLELAVLAIELGALLLSIFQLALKLGELAVGVTLALALLLQL
jgi:hypothetical protein